MQLVSYPTVATVVLYSTGVHSSSTVSSSSTYLLLQYLAPNVESGDIFSSIVYCTTVTRVFVIQYHSMLSTPIPNYNTSTRVLPATWYR
jgi:hypothetical protein